MTEWRSQLVVVFAQVEAAFVMLDSAKFKLRFLTGFALTGLYFLSASTSTEFNARKGKGKNLHLTRAIYT